MVAVEVIVTDIQVIEGPGILRGAIEAHQEEHLLDTEAEEAEVQYHVAPVTAAETIVVAVAPSGAVAQCKVVAPFRAAVVLQWRWVDHTSLLGLRGQDLHPEAEAHQGRDQGPHWIPDPQFGRAKAGPGHHQEAQ